MTAERDLGRKNTALVKLAIASSDIFFTINVFAICSQFAFDETNVINLSKHIVNKQKHTKIA